MSIKSTLNAISRAKLRGLSVHKLSTAAFASALICVIWMAVWLLLSNEGRSLRRDSETDVTNLSIIFEQNAARTLGDIDRLLLFLRETHERSESGAEWPSVVRGRFTADKETLQIAVTDAVGRMITSSQSKPGDKPVDLSDREHFRVHKITAHDHLFVSKPLIGRVTGKWSIQLSRRYFDKQGQFGGVIVVSLDPDHLSRAYGEVDLGSGGGLALVGDDDIIRAGTGSYKSLLGRAVTAQAFKGQSTELPRGAMLYRDVRDTVERTIVTRPLAGLPLYVLVSGRNLVLDAAWAAKRRAYVTGAGVLTIITALAMLGALRIRKQHERHITYLARHDPLTGLANRTSLSERLDAIYADAVEIDRVALHLIDLDRFKFVNDTYGHPIGDKLLAMVAQRLREALRQTDLVARIGGDEFAVLQLGLANQSDAAQVADRLVKALNQLYQIEGLRIEIGASVGIALVGPNATSAVDLVKSADLALYTAKSDGRNCYRFFDPVMEAAVKGRRQVEEQLRVAIERQQLELHYQPISDITTREITGYEALVRWCHPERGLIPPLEFIPIAEETGLIVQIGSWVLRRACADMACRTGHLKVAVNVSPVQFKDPRLVEDIKQALSESNLPPDRLEVEITESVLMQQDTLTNQHLRAIRELGVKISMDDFGTGYSSLSYLQHYPISCIKIDRSFVKTLGSGGSASAIVRAITSLASAMNIGTIAEGVETKEQLDELIRLGCDEAQGYYFSPPRPASQILPPAAVEKRAIAEAA